MPDVSADPPATAPAAHASSLAAYTTLRLGGPAGTLTPASETDEAVEIMRGAARKGERVLVLAGGSNVVIADEGFPGQVMLLRTRGTRVVDRDSRGVLVRVAAGEPWDGFVAATLADGLSGLEALSGIPGSAGATPIQNVGAYGQEVAHTVEAVHVYDRLDDQVKTLSLPECRFAYRSSVFKRNDRWLVLEVDFRLAVATDSAPIRYAELARNLGVEAGERVPAKQVRDTVLKLRAGKGMVLDPEDLDTRSVGSFFTNPVLSAQEWAGVQDRLADAGEPPSWPAPNGTVKVPAAWLIEKAGFAKGYGRRGGVAISSKHTLALTHRGGGTTTALLELAREIRDGVHDRFGVVLHPEPVLVNCVL
ncbi:UDP-N-acetylmuramate dehydrogenase [Couchioplanes caeruleus]|uniref:UDP-N-acetylenolpyruvoylglucosamine reductase n=1 Tax=Couchioplanes caeruleus subsp. caeruleus TaxID=56427 RepID=A0A1K0FY85_9ACTN|nr:UDP-N-acetylmuramate dehydrogenase [Couchioplanes caeruleus]OJF10034.1 UDP-N-acetylenolpyruvoylglucosamine reductase [Couchioplanes caeruleus subsp. caeruleus]